MNIAEQKAVLTIAMMAALADGQNTDTECAALRRMVENFGPSAEIDLWAIYQDVVGRRRTIDGISTDLTTAEGRSLAYEMARGVCEADDAINEQERTFLEALRTAFGLPATPPPIAAPAPEDLDVPAQLEPVDTQAIDKMVINYSILNAALELLPQRLATMAIVPLQMRMVYRIGKRHGYTLDRGHLRDFLATAGVGLAAQALENMARRIIGGLAGQLLGGVGRVLIGAGTEAAFAFASTYAIGQLAIRYYSGGRKMETAVLRDTYARLLADGKTLFGQHAGAVQSRASTLNPTDVINLVRNPA